MADYQPLIARAVEGLADPAPDLRQAVYERAREALIGQLRSLDPPLSDADIDREAVALSEAIDRVEAVYAAQDAVEPAAPVISPPPQPEAEAPPRLPERLETKLPRASQPAEAPLRGRTAARSGEDAPADAQPRERPRVGSRDGEPRAEGRGRGMIVGAVLLLVLALIATTAYFLRDDPSGLPAEPIAPEASPAPPAPAADNKLGDRVGGVAPAAPPAPAASPASPAVAVAQRATLFEENTADPRGEPKATPGRALWRLDSLNPGQGRPLETVVRATVEIAQAELTMNLLIRRNTDQSLPASHTIEVAFTTAAGDRSRAVRDVGLLQTKAEVGVRGTPAAGLQVRVDDNLFLIGLSNLPQDVERNTEFLARRNWLDLPIVFNSGQRAIISFEKGISGEQAINQAFERWR